MFTILFNYHLIESQTDFSPTNLEGLATKVSEGQIAATKENYLYSIHSFEKYDAAKTKLVNTVDKHVRSSIKNVVFLIIAQILLTCFVFIRYRALLKKTNNKAYNKKFKHDAET